MKPFSIIPLTIAALTLVAGCTKKTETTTQTESQTTTSTSTADLKDNKSAAPTAQDTNELKMIDMQVGKGAEATAGKLVTVHYTGWLTNGKEFDSSVKRNQPFTFKLGGGQVIPGWDKGVQGMKVGGKRKLTIPPQLGYGEREVGGVIPSNSTLIFEVELLKVEDQK